MHSIFTKISIYVQYFIKLVFIDFKYYIQTELEIYNIALLGTVKAGFHRLVTFVALMM